MKKILDRIWGWMKSTAWFQVVILVGVVVAIVLCISPISRAIQNATAEADKVKYYMYNRISYNELTEKIDALDKGTDTDGFAVLFSADNTSAGSEEGIQAYVDSNADSVPVYIMNTGVTDDDSGKSKYDTDDDWYDYYKLSKTMFATLSEAGSQVFEAWRKEIKSYPDSGEIDQGAETNQSPVAESLPTSLMWFRPSSQIDESVLPLTTVDDDVTGETDVNFHIAKVYLDFVDDDGGDNTKTQVQTGLMKFFGVTSEGTRSTASILPSHRG